MSTVLLLKVLFTFGCAPAALASFVMMHLSKRPSKWKEHLAWLGRLMIFAGGVFGIARVWGKPAWTPYWHEIVFVTGIGILTAIHSWSAWYDALKREKNAKGEADPRSGLTLVMRKDH